MDLTIYNSYTAQACVLVILGLYQSLEYPVQLIIFWCWEWKQNHLAFKIHVFFFFSSVIHGSLKISIWFVYLIWRIDGLMDVKEECAKFGAVKGFKFTGDSNTGYKVFVEFSNADDCSRAHSALTGRDFNGRTVITSFYPIDYYHIDYFWCWYFFCKIQKKIWTYLLCSCLWIKEKRIFIWFLQIFNSEVNQS